MNEPKQACSPHGWTLDTLETHLSKQVDHLTDTIKEHDDRNKERFQAAEKAVTMAMVASDKALTKAEMASEKRFESVNEFRATLSDQATLLLPRAEYAVQHQALVDKIDGTSKRLLTLEAGGIGRREGIGNIGAIVLGIVAGLSAIGTISATVILLVKLSR